jgi:hypothetical protein
VLPGGAGRFVGRKVSMVSRIVPQSKITKVSPTPSRPARSAAAVELAPAISWRPPGRTGFGPMSASGMR